MKKYFYIPLLLLSTLSADTRVGGQIVIDRAITQNDDSHLSNSEIRRARLFLKSDISKKFKYEIEYSFTKGGKWKDVYLSYLFNKNLSLTVGNIKEPIGLEALTSSKYNSFLERSLTDLFINDRKIGALLSYGEYKKSEFSYHFAIGGFTKDINDFQSDNKYSLVARGVYANFIDKKSFIHLGMAGSFTDFDDTKLKLSTRLESHMAETKYLKTKINHIDNTNRFASEMIVQFAPFTLQGEYFTNQISTTTGESYDFNGWYLQISSFLSNESKRYKPKEGIFGRMKPKHPVTKKGFGSFELTFRTSHINLDDKDKLGGTAQTYTTGLNWYLAKNMRFMINHLTTDVEIRDKTYNPKVVQARFQYDF